MQLLKYLIVQRNEYTVLFVKGCADSTVLSCLLVLNLVLLKFQYNEVKNVLCSYVLLRTTF
jgi:hypothetical protein